ncbi:DegV family protein [Marinimicrobium agarilyticum]|uniref:DegV family protein n=1 Tax=Marinimicrobium agarilyticum TaxID=306546 RepID=UPI000416DED1|nr:DegV family protein [Marinimicrobium agarilyticum]
MNARTCIAVDSTCDLPAQFIKDHNIEVLPIYIKHAGGQHLDSRNTKNTLQFYKDHTREKYGLAQSEPMSVEDITQLLKRKLFPNYDLVQVITTNSKKSDVFKRVSEAALVNEPKFRAMERDDADRPPFRIRLYDSMSMFTGHALLVYELIKRLEEEKRPLNRSIREIDQMREEVYGYIIPNDLGYMRERRHMRKSDHKISWINFKLASILNRRPIIQLHKGDTAKMTTGKGFWGSLEVLFDHVRKQMAQGLTSEVVTMSYGGALEEIKEHPVLVKFRQDCQKAGVKTMLSMMSMAGTVNVGPGAFALAFATDKDLV